MKKAFHMNICFFVSLVFAFSFLPHGMAEEYDFLVVEEMVPLEAQIDPQQTGSTVVFCTEAYQDMYIELSVNGDRAGRLDCGNNITLHYATADALFWSAVGYDNYGGGVWYGSLYVDGSSSYLVKLCPQGGGCCPLGCGSGGAFLCSQCQTNPISTSIISTTSTSITPGTTSSIAITTTSTANQTTTSSIRPTTTTSIEGEFVVRNNMITNDPKPNTGCATPVSNELFYYYDAMAFCWCLYDNISVGDQISWKWFAPDGELYYESSLESTFTGSGCAWSGISIGVSVSTDYPGYWRSEIYFEDRKVVTAYFTVVAFVPDTTTIPTTTAFTTTTTAPSFCPMAIIYGEQSDEVETLRWYRDNVLRQTPEGRELIKLYYLWSPIIVKAMEQDEGFKEEIKQMIDGVLPMIKDDME